MTTISTEINEATTPRICIGIDIGKAHHVAGVVSHTLLSEYRRYDKCPTLTFHNSREEFAVLLEFIQSYGPPESLAVLIEVTGHYHRLLLDYLTTEGITCYLVTTMKRIGEQKTDRRDALRLSYALYAFLTFGQQPAEREIRPVPAIPQDIITLGRLVRHRYELVQDLTRCKNRLTALCDELFPELTQVCADPNGAFALTLRERFPTATAVARASLDELKACRAWSRPSTAGLVKLQALAQTSIGCVEPGRTPALCLEQQQVMEEARLFEEQIAHLEREITRLLTSTREGQIVLSIDGIGLIPAATLVGTIGTITRFETVKKLRSYVGWSPVKAQSGTTLDTERVRRGGHAMTKHILYLVALSAITHDTAWQVLYRRLLARRNAQGSKIRLIGRICGEIIQVVYDLLKADAEVLASVQEGAEPPAPVLYDREAHLARLTSKREQKGETGEVTVTTEEAHTLV